MSPLNRELGLTSHFGVLVSQNQQAEKGLPVSAGAPDPEVGGWALLPPWLPELPVGRFWGTPSNPSLPLQCTMDCCGLI